MHRVGKPHRRAHHIDQAIGIEVIGRTPTGELSDAHTQPGHPSSPWRANRGYPAARRYRFGAGGSRFTAETQGTQKGGTDPRTPRSVLEISSPLLLDHPPPDPDAEPYPAEKDLTPAPAAHHLDSAITNLNPNRSKTPGWRGHGHHLVRGVEAHLRSAVATVGNGGLPAMGIVTVAGRGDGGSVARPRSKACIRRGSASPLLRGHPTSSQEENSQPRCNGSDVRDRDSSGRCGRCVVVVQGGVPCGGFPFAPAQYRRAAGFSRRWGGAPGTPVTDSWNSSLRERVPSARQAVIPRRPW